VIGVVLARVGWTGLVALNTLTVGLLLIPLLTSPNVYGMKRDLEFMPRPDYLLTMFDAVWVR